jgi:conjugative relaxase-like TrwC/TraI family protein
MLRINQQRSAAGAKSYFEEGLAREDYYTQDSIVGRWGGKGAQSLGLVGEVSREAFLTLCDNKNPNTGRTLTARTRENRTVGYDFNFHAPKSLSLLYTLTRDERLLSAFRDSVQQTMHELEVEVKTRVRTAGQNAERVTGNLLFAEFVHLTSRPVNGVPDPHLHAHCFVFNATFDSEEDRWKAAQFREVVRDAPYFEAAFHARLSKAVAELGLGIERTKTGWEVAGLAKPTLEKFSRRTALIEDLARQKGISTAEEKGKLGAKTREKKGPPKSLDALRAEWKSRLDKAERRAVADVVALRVPSAEAPVTVRESVDHALLNGFERCSVVADRRLLATALKRGYGSVRVEDVRNEFEGRHEVIRKEWGEQTFVTTREVLAEEAALLHFAREGRGTCAPINPVGQGYHSPDLNSEQLAAVQHVLSSTDQVMLIRGAAGTGKTRLLVSAAQAIHDAGAAVHVFAPTSEASRGVLRQAGFEKADTVARLLVDQNLQARVKGQVMWVDEAGLLGTRDLRALLKVAEEQNARVVLMGDERQHGSVPRGDAFRLLQTHAGLKPAEVSTIRRQQGQYRAAVQALASGDLESGFAQLDRLGAIREVPDEERHTQLAADYLIAVRESKSALVVAPTHAEGREVTDRIRTELRSAERIGEKDRVFIQLTSYGLTEAQRKGATNYQSGDVVRFQQNVKGGFKKGEAVSVVGRDKDGVRVKRSRGRPVSLPLEEARHFDLYEKRDLPLAAGDRIRITQNGTTADGGRLFNGSLHTVEGFDRCGNILLEGGKVVSRDYGHLTHGYCTTSHASQGKTVDRVLVALGPESFAAASREQFYVSVSRGRESVTVYCADKQELKEAVVRSSARPSATELTSRPQPAIQDRARLLRHGEHTRRQERLRQARQSSAARDMPPVSVKLGRERDEKGLRR